MAINFREADLGLPFTKVHRWRDGEVYLQHRPPRHVVPHEEPVRARYLTIPPDGWIALFGALAAASPEWIPGFPPEWSAFEERYALGGWTFARSMTTVRVVTSTAQGDAVGFHVAWAAWGEAFDHLSLSRAWEAA